MTDTPDHPSVDDLIVQLRAKVEEREREGYYPVELSTELHEHFRRIAGHRSSFDRAEVGRAVDALDAAAAFSPDRIPVASDAPGGAVLHSLVAKVVARQTQGVLEQMQQFADAVRHVFRLLVEAIEEPQSHVHGDLVGQIDALFAHVAASERGPIDSAAAVADLRRRLAALEENERLRSFRPFFSNDQFEEAFRGTRKDLHDRYRDVARNFLGCDPVLDIGCGRGEFLELLTLEGVKAAGVEVDRALVDECLELGLDVQHGDGLAVLRGLDDASLGGISLIQVIEHMTPQQAVDVVATAYEKLRPGGKLLIETVNPQSLYVFAHAFYLDPTHTQPVHPAYLCFVAQQAGFRAVEIDWRSAPPLDDTLAETGVDDEVGKTVDENVRRLNRLLFAPQDYALIATR